jgi:hypothetical protein
VSRSNWMSTFPAVALSVALGSCATPEPLQKTGSDKATTDNDTAECRQAAQAEAVRLYPHVAGVPTLGGTGMMMSQQRDANSRAVAEAHAFKLCMQNKGYARPTTAK